MLTIFQFPISDTRSFDIQEDLKLPDPYFPNPRTGINPQFVNFFGKAVDRRLRAEEAWPDEIKFCLAKRALRFDNLAIHHAGQPETRFMPNCVFRRLFSDGDSVARVEIGFTHNKKAKNLSSLKPHQVLAIISDLCILPSFIHQIDGKKVMNHLIRQGSALARLYARATIPSASKNKKRAEVLVRTGNPIVVIELKPSEAEFPLVPKGFVSIPAEKSLGANLSFGRLRTQDGDVGTWILQRGNATEVQSRNLRLCVLRLHAEQEALDLAINQLKSKRFLNQSETTDIDKLDDYFNKKTRLINRTIWSGVNQSAILAAFDAAEQVTDPAIHENLIEGYKGARRQIQKKIEDYKIRRAADGKDQREERLYSGERQRNCADAGKS